MKIAVVTTFNQKLYDYYAHRFMNTYNWPFDLYVYHEGWHPKQDKVFFRDIHKTNPEVKEFIERNRHRNINSTDPNDHSKIIPGTNYKNDAIRFCYKVFAKTHLMLECDYDYVFWADADIVFKKPITEKEVIEKLLPEDCSISYIDRPTYYSECGFVGYNLKRYSTQKFIYNLRKYYTKDLLYNEREWHDSYVWDCVRKKYLQDSKTHNLAPRIDKVGNPWPNTFMSEYCDHLKGKKRKDTGEMLK